MKYKNFQDVPQITQANYKVNVSWKYLEDHIEHYKEGDMKVILEPQFQRAHVWTEEQQSKYVEWILRGGRSGREILWNCAGWMGDFRGPMYLVDGLQRITAVRKFLNNELLAFETLHNDFSGVFNLLHCDFIFYVNDLKKYKDVLKWYLDINSGGTVHTEEELEKVKILLLEEKTKELKKTHDKLLKGKPNDQ